MRYPTMHFLFHLDECGVVTKDDEGHDLPDIHAAKAFALKSVRDIMCAEISEGRLCLSCAMLVSDEDGALMFVLPFRDAVAITGA